MGGVAGERSHQRRSDGTFAMFCVDAHPQPYLRKAWTDFVNHGSECGLEEDDLAIKGCQEELVLRRRGPRTERIQARPARQRLSVQVQATGSFIAQTAPLASFSNPGGDQPIGNLAR